MPLTVNPVDPNTATEQPPPYSPTSQPGVEAEPQQPPSSAQEASTPSGQQDPTLPGSTPETSTQMPKEGEASSAGGKSPLRFDPNAPAVDTVAQPDKLRVEGQLDPGKGPERQIHSSQIPPQRGPERAWEDQARQALNGLYPRLREGEDWAIGRETIDGELKLLAGEDKGVDWGKVQEAARKLAGADPYSDYKPKPGIGQPRSEGYELGERHSDAPNRELPPNVAQSEVNPQTQDKVPSQAYPGPQYDPGDQEDRPQGPPP